MNDDVLALLRRIAVAVEKLANGGESEIAPDRDLDSKYGDEVVRLNPRDWTGAPYKGRRMSECPPDFLDMLAEAYAYFGRRNKEADARTDEGKPKWEYDKRSERRARGWAERIRSGRHTQRTETPVRTGWGSGNAAGGWRSRSQQPSAPNDRGPMDDDIPFAWLLPLALPATAILGWVLA